VSQRLIPTGERSGLQTRIADDGKRFVVHADERLTAFVGYRIVYTAGGGWRLRNLGREKQSLFC
jgi:hypothetical protein